MNDTPQQQVNERTLEDLLEYDTPQLLAFDRDKLRALMADAITRQDAILAKVPRKKDPSDRKVDLRSGASRKSARDDRDKMQFLPAEYLDIFKQTQELADKAAKKGVV